MADGMPVVMRRGDGSVETWHNGVLVENRPELGAAPSLQGPTYIVGLKAGLVHEWDVCWSLHRLWYARYDERLKDQAARARAIREGDLEGDDSEGDKIGRRARGRA